MGGKRGKTQTQPMVEEQYDVEGSMRALVQTMVSITKTLNELGWEYLRGDTLKAAQQAVEFCHEHQEYLTPSDIRYCEGLKIHVEAVQRKRDAP